LVLSPEILAEKLNIHQLIAEIMIDRGIDTNDKVEKFLNGNLNNLYDPSSIPDIDKITKIIKEYTYFSTIGIYSDYDVDGIASAYIMYTALKKMAPNSKINIYISDRFRDGYGLSKTAIDMMAQQKTELIITLDCGISNYKEIAYAQKKGINVVVIDHHESDNPSNTPYIDLKVRNDFYPFKELCGAGICWKIAQYMLQEEFLEVLDVAAIATVADVVPLIDENRIIVTEGIKRIQEGNLNCGIQAIIDVNTIDRKNLNSMDIGFNIGPLINATGRLGSAYPALQLLLEDNPEERSCLAHELYQTNKQRQKITKEIFQEIEKNINEKDKVIVWESKAHQGIVGLIAGRLTSRYNKPAIIIDKMSRKGSCRSIEPFNLYDNLKICLEEGLLDSAGGHAMAAGISLPRKNFIPFKTRINQLANNTEYITTDYDKEISLNQINETLVNDLNILEPYGNGNRRPLFLTRRTKPKSIWVLPGGEHIKFVVNGIEAIAFRKAYLEKELKKKSVNLIYTIGWNEWNGKKTIQLIIEKINPSLN